MSTDKRDEDARRRLAGGVTAERLVRWLANVGERDLLAGLLRMRRVCERAERRGVA